MSFDEDLIKTMDHFMSEPRRGAHNSVTYRFKASSGTNMYIIVNVDEFNVISGLFVNIGESGTTIHNVVNAMGRMISLGIQEKRKTDPQHLNEYLLKIVSNLEGMTSDVVWMNDTLGRANSIPDVMSLIILRQIELDDAMDDMHSGEEDEEE